MNSSRLKHLLDFLKEDPNDAFTLYAIATELKNTEPQKALEYYEQLLCDHPNYVATYYHAAHLYIALGKDGKAEETFKKGIALAQQQEQALALRELQNAYNEFLFE